MNQIYTSEGNIMFVKANGKITNVHPFNVYTHFNKDTVSFVLIALPESSGLSFFTSKADDLEIDGEQYTFDELKEVIPEKFKMSGAQARCEIVEELPTTGQTNTIYLVPIVEGTQINRYDEYIYIKEQEKWELLGDTSIEMDKYYTKTQVDEKLSAKADTATTYTKVQVDALLNDKQDTLTAGDGITISGDVISFDSDKERTIATALSELKNEKLETSAFDVYSAATDTAIANKQDTLVSGTNIKTINNESILGSGNITIEGGGGKAISGGTNISITTGETADTINCTLPISADSKGIYTTSTYPFLSTSNKSGNVVFGYNNILDTFGSYKSSNYNLFFGSDNHITVNGSGMLIGGLNNKDGGNYTNMSACVALGNSNIVKNPYEFASGQFNQTNYDSASFGLSGNTLFSVGNGIGNSSRHSAFEIKQNGDIYVPNTDDTSTANWYQKPMVRLQDTITATAANTTALGGLKLVKLTQSEYDALSTKDSMTLYIIEEAPECNVPSTATWHNVDNTFDRTTQIYGIDFGGGDGGNDNTGRDYELYVRNQSNTVYSISCHIPDPNADNGDYNSITINNSDGTLYRQIDNTATINSFCEIFGQAMYISANATIPSYEQCVDEQCTNYECIQYDEETGECIEQGDCINTECMQYETTYFITALY